jgi:hypothetical protein
MKRITKLLLVAVMAAGLVAALPSAVSADAGVAVLTGTAVTDKLGLPGTPCTDGGVGTAGQCNWSITLASAGCTGTNCSGLPATFAGTLGPVGGAAGPACGASSGKQVGSVSAFGHTISNLEWLSSVGSVFPVIGDSNHGPDTVVVLVRVNPTNPTDCASGNASSFTVNAVSSIAAA